MKSIRSLLESRATLATPEMQVTRVETTYGVMVLPKEYAPLHLHINTQVPACSSLVKEFRPAVNKVLQWRPEQHGELGLKYLNLSVAAHTTAKKKNFASSYFSLVDKPNWNILPGRFIH